MIDFGDSGHQSGDQFVILWTTRNEIYYKEIIFSIYYEFWLIFYIIISELDSLNGFLKKSIKKMEN